MRVSIADIILSIVIGAWIDMVWVCSRADDCVKGGVLESQTVYFSWGMEAVTVPPVAFHREIGYNVPPGLKDV